MVEIIIKINQKVVIIFYFRGLDWKKKNYQEKKKRARIEIEKTIRRGLGLSGEIQNHCKITKGEKGPIYKGGNAIN